MPPPLPPQKKAAPVSKPTVTFEQPVKPGSLKRPNERESPTGYEPPVKMSSFEGESDDSSDDGKRQAITPDDDDGDLVSTHSEEASISSSSLESHSTESESSSVLSVTPKKARSNMRGI